mgnify:CR=1 FL=1
MEGPGAHLELLHGGADEAAPRLVELAHPPHLPRPHVRVAGQRRSVETLPLGLPGALDTLADRRGGLTQPVVSQFVVVDAGYLDVDVDAVHSGVTQIGISKTLTVSLR